MNISQVMPNFKGRSINRQNSMILHNVFEQIPQNIVGGISGLIRSDVLQISKKIRNCGSSAVIAYSSGTEKAVEMSRCGIHKICPVCADAVSGKRIKKIDSALSENYTNSKFAYMLTFTLKDGQDLNERVQLLNDSYRRWYLMGRKRSDEKNSLGEASKIIGLSKSLEIKIGANSQEWHPHLHCISFAESEIDFRVYSEQVRKLYEKSKRNDFKKFMIENNGLLYPFADNCERLRDLYVDLYGVYDYHSFSMWRINKSETLVSLYNRGGCSWLSFTGDSKISREWRIATGFEGQNIKVNVLYTEESRPKKYESFLKSIDEKEVKFSGEKMAALKAVKYSLKYSVKPSDLVRMTPEQIFTMLDVSRKHRSIEFKGFLRSEAKQEQLLYSPMVDLHRNESVISETEIFPQEEIAEFADFRFQMENSDIGTYRTNNQIEDNRYKTYLKQVEDFLNYEPVNLSDEEKKNLNELLLSGIPASIDEMGQIDDEVRRDIEKLVYGMTPPEEIADEPKGEISPAGASQYFPYRPWDMKGDFAKVALYQLGADYHKIFHREVTQAAAKYRQLRAAAFDQYKKCLGVPFVSFSNVEYVSTVENLKHDLKKTVAELREKRNSRIDKRSNGLYSLIIDSEDKFKKRIERDFAAPLLEMPPRKTLKEMEFDGKTASEKRRKEDEQICMF